MSGVDSLKEELENLLLSSLQQGEAVEDSSVFIQSKKRGEQEKVFNNVIKSLSAFEIVTAEEIRTEVVTLSDEAKTYVQHGLPEVQLFDLLADGPKLLPEIKAKLGDAVTKIGQQQCCKNKWVNVTKSKSSDGKKPIVTLERKVDAIPDTMKAILEGASKDMAKVSEPNMKILKNRRFITNSTKISYKVSKGPKFIPKRKRLPIDLSLDMLNSGEWKNMEFKEMNLSAKGAPVASGALHPLLKFRSELRSILLAMGFEEMPTNNYVESCFWNFDALFQPQQHPARDSHDTFFIKEPSTCRQLPPQEYVERVMKTHIGEGGAVPQSIGYRCPWSLDEAKKNILRTHTTAVSSRMLYKLGQKCMEGGTFKPHKYFSIDRVFRNETLDATHLAEFHQVEGLVADRNLTLGDLIGVIKTFFSKIGISDVRFKPAYNPYTEPSMEIFGYSKELGKLIEVGNSGIFRPEMLRPMGIPEDVNVIAWGLGLERPTMIKYGYKKIKELFGHGVNLKLIEENAVCRFY